VSFLALRLPRIKNPVAYSGPAAPSNYTVNLSGCVTHTDATAKTAVLNKADSASSSDAIVKSPVKNLADSSTTSDAIVKSPAKKPADSVAPSDAIVKSPIKSAADASTPSDTATRAVTLRRSDTVTTSNNAVPSIVLQVTGTIALLLVQRDPLKLTMKQVATVAPHRARPCRTESSGNGDAHSAHCSALVRADQELDL
jgi:hypothetical protein